MKNKKTKPGYGTVNTMLNAWIVLENPEYPVVVLRQPNKKFHKKVHPCVIFASLPARHKRVSALKNEV